MDDLGDYLDYLDVHDRQALGITAAPPQVVYAKARLPEMHSLVRPDFVSQAPAQRLRAALLPAGRVVALQFGVPTPTEINPGRMIQPRAPFDPLTPLAPLYAAPAANPANAPAQDSNGTFVPGPPSALPAYSDSNTSTGPSPYAPVYSGADKPADGGGGSSSQTPGQTYSTTPADGGASSQAPGGASSPTYGDKGADGSSASGDSGRSSSAFGWFALLAGGYVMWRALK